MTTTDPYQLLSLPSTATRQQIRDRYTLLALAPHAESRKLRDAHDLLMDPIRRSFYDMTQRINKNMDERARWLQGDAQQTDREIREREEADEQRGRVYAEFLDERRRLRPDEEGRKNRSTTNNNYGTGNSDQPQLYPTLSARVGEHTPLFSGTNNNDTDEPWWSEYVSTVWKAIRPRINVILTLFILLLFFGIPSRHSPTQPPPPTIPTLPPTTTLPPPPPTAPVPYERKIAIIGAGPAGVSTAYHLSHLASLSHIPHHITIFEQSSHIGGRSVLHIPIIPGTNLDVGATTFSKTASLLSKAAAHLGLDLHPSNSGTRDLVGEGSGSFGVYDGRSWSYIEPNPENLFGRAWWNSRLWQNYGDSVGKAENLITAARQAREKLYESTSIFTSLSTIVHTVGLDVFSKVTGASMLSEHDVQENFQREIFNPWVRGRYAQNLGTISALGAMMAADNSAVFEVTDEKGISTLWEGMVASTNATVKLSTHVRGLRKGDWGGWILASESGGREALEPFDAIVLASPWGLTQLEIRGDRLFVEPESVQYAEMFITLFSSNQDISGDEFSGHQGMPGLVLTTPCSWEWKEISEGTGREGMGHAPFWVLSKVKEVVRGGAREWLYKIVSEQEVSDDHIRKLLGGKENEEKRWSWDYRHHVRASHPLLTPRDRFSEIVLDENLWYSGAVDELTTGVEMASLMGNNIAELVVLKWQSEGEFPADYKKIPKEGPPGMWNHTKATV